MHLTLDQIRVVDAIDRLGSFSAAGEELHRATSAISYAVKTLEDSLGIPMFDRSGYRAALTPEGRLLLEEGRRLLEQEARLQHLATQLREGWEPKLSVVMDGVLPMKPMARALRRFSAEKLPTHLQVRVEYLGGVRERFVRDPARFMLAVDAEPDVLHVARPLPPVEMLLVVRGDHALARPSGVTREELMRHVEVIVEESTKEAPPRPGRLFMGSPHVFWLGDFQSKREAILEGVGFGWMPRHLIDEDLQRGRLVHVGFDQGAVRPLVAKLIYRRDASLGRAARLFLDLLEQEMGMTPPAASDDGKHQKTDVGGPASSGRS